MQNNQNEILFPLDIQVHNGETCVMLARLPQVNFKEPFFVDSLSRRFQIADISKKALGEQDVLVRPLHFDDSDTRFSYVPIDEFISQYVHSELDVSKTKFIFHMSRCGSTLVTQMLATSERFFVVSEPQIFNAVLNPKFMPQEPIKKMRLLRAVVGAISACKPAGVDHTFIKFRSWNSLFMKNILETFPEIQWMYVHRNGIEVLESVLRDPPGWLRSRHTYASFFAGKFDVSVEELEQLSESEYAIRLLGIFCEIAASQISSRALYVDYDDIVKNLPMIVEEHWNLVLTDAERDAMFARTKIYSKDSNVTQEFVPDSEAKRKVASDDDRVLSQTYIETQRNTLKGLLQNRI
jgi:Trp operon repressor